MSMMYVTSEKEVLKFEVLPLERMPSPACSSVSCEQNVYCADVALHFWLPISHDLTPCEFFLLGFVKEAVYVQSLPATMVDLNNRITTAVNSVTQDILLRVWDEFGYRLDVIRAAGGEQIEHLQTLF
jgi:hypothetical protein